jgi:coniferyl-aldehyde dehydrogenase
VASAVENIAAIRRQADSNLAAGLESQLARLKRTAAADPYPSAKVRKDRIRRVVDELIRSEKLIVEAAAEDFGGRHAALTLLTDVLAPVRSLRYALRHVDRWMKPEKRNPEFPMAWIGARAYIFYQPLGVVGMVAPWNAPVALAFSPLGGVLAAGNLAMIKPSELTPNISALTCEMVKRAFDDTEVVAIEGEAEVAAAFTALPFDHLVFTGGASTARKVLMAAAPNLVPVTLELGGKSPAIVAPGADLAYAAGKIAFGKLANAGQVCMAPDFALVHRADQAAFVNLVRAAMKRQYPDVANNLDFTRIHLQRQRQRLSAMLIEAQKKGARIEVLSGENLTELEYSKRFPPVIVVDPPADCTLMTEEVFGPVLPIVAYDKLENATQLLANLPRPLALYFLGGNAAERDYILKNSYAGGMTFDDIMLHPFMQDLPFGGVGQSGMGRYLGAEGFQTFSNAKAVLKRPWIDVSRYLTPPFTPAYSKIMRRALRF